MFRSIDPRELELNPFKAIGDEWMLIAAADGEKANAMTASWGGAGIMWGDPVATCYIRPQRYTRELVDAEECFSLCFFGQEQRNALNLCGTLSGRDSDKMERSGLTVLNDRAAPYFAEASVVLMCRKIYRQEMTSACFLDDSIAKHYPGEDYHIMYIGRIEECLVRD